MNIQLAVVICNDGIDRIARYANGGGTLSGRNISLEDDFLSSGRFATIEHEAVDRFKVVASELDHVGRLVRRRKGDGRITSRNAVNSKEHIFALIAFLRKLEGNPSTNEFLCSW